MPHPPFRQKEEQKKFLLVPIDLGPEKKQGNLIHYGTGIRGPPSPDAATIHIGDWDAPPGQNRCFRLRFPLFYSCMQLGFGPHVLLHEGKNILFLFRNGNIRILAETVK